MNFILFPILVFVISVAFECEGQAPGNSSSPAISNDCFSGYFRAPSFPYFPSGRQHHDSLQNASDNGTIRLRNWGGNVMFSTQNIQYPRSVEEVQQIVRRAKKLRVLASRHSFNNIADSKDTILHTQGLNSVIGINNSVPSVTVGAGIRYIDVVDTIQSAGFALPNLASLSQISVGGAIQNGVHGSGKGVENLATQVLSLQMVLANGTLLNLGRGDPRLKAVVVGLGAFGVVTQVELQLVPTYNTSAYVFVNIPAEQVYANFDEIQNLGYSINLVSTLSNTSVFDQVVIIARSDAANRTVSSLQNLFGAPLVAAGAPQVWHTGLMGPFSVGPVGDELQTEYFVPYSKAVNAIKAVSALQSIIKPMASVFLIRTIKNDDLWMSSQSGPNSLNTTEDYHVAIHLSWPSPNMTAIDEILPRVEEVLVPFGARPHWGKYYTMKPKDNLKNYPKLAEFKKLAEEFDPEKKFRNKYLEENVFAEF